MSKEKNSFGVIVLVIVLLVFMFIIGWFLGEKFKGLDVKIDDSIHDNGNNNFVNENVDKIEDEGLSDVEFYNKIRGTWYRTNDNDLKYGLTLSTKNYDGVGVNFYDVYPCGSDGGIQGVIFSIKYLGNNVYQVYSYSEGCNGNHCVNEKEPSINRALIDISDIDNKSIKVSYENSSNKDIIYKLWESEKYLCE